MRMRARELPVVVVMAGGYAPDIEAIVTIHSNTIREAVRFGVRGHAFASL